MCCLNLLMQLNCNSAQIFPGTLPLCSILSRLLIELLSTAVCLSALGSYVISKKIAEPSHSYRVRQVFLISPYDRTIVSNTFWKTVHHHIYRCSTSITCKNTDPLFTTQTGRHITRNPVLVYYLQDLLLELSALMTLVVLCRGRSKSGLTPLSEHMLHTMSSPPTRALGSVASYSPCPSNLSSTAHSKIQNLFMVLSILSGSTLGQSFK